MRKLSVPEKHQLKIAHQTLKYSDVGARIMGGMTKSEARIVIKRLTGRTPRENPRLKRRYARKTKKNYGRARRSVLRSLKRYSKRRNNPSGFFSIRSGDTVYYNQYAGRGRHGAEYRQAKGRAVMRGSHGWVLNIGGKHGTPAVVDERNFISVSHKK